MKRIVLFCLAVVGVCFADTLEWDANVEPNVVGYNVYWGPKTNVCFFTNYVYVGNNLFFSLTNFPAGDYQFALTALADNGLESEMSEVVYWLNTNNVPVPPAPPKNVRIRLGVQSKVNLEDSWISQTNQYIDMVITGSQNFFRATVLAERF